MGRHNTLYLDVSHYCKWLNLHTPKEDFKLKVDESQSRSSNPRAVCSLDQIGSDQIWIGMLWKIFITT